MTADTAGFERSMAREFFRLYPDEFVRHLERLSPVETAEFLAALEIGSASEILSRLMPDVAGEVVARLEPQVAGTLLARLAPSDVARIVSRLDEGSRDRLLASQSPSRAAELREHLAFSPGTAGALMDSEVLALRPETTVHDALTRLRNFRRKRVHRVFVVDPDHRLLGSVRLRDLVVAEPATALGTLLLDKPAGVRTVASREEVVDALARARTSSLPVVDFDGHLVGVLRQDALMQAAREEATVDIQSMVGAGKEERALSKASLAVRKRLPWLEVNLVTAFLAASVVGVFESTIARFTALAVLLPVVAGQSGNTGAQALAVTMRGLALREIRTSQWLRVCIKEATVGLVNGVAVALTTAVAVFVWSRSLGLALVIGVSMVVSMVAAGISGASIPMVLTSMGQDPAQSSSIILTTVTDVVGFFSFLGLATVLAGLL